MRDLGFREFVFTWGNLASGGSLEFVFAIRLRVGIRLWEFVLDIRLWGRIRLPGGLRLWDLSSLFILLQRALGECVFGEKSTTAPSGCTAKVDDFFTRETIDVWYAGLIRSQHDSASVCLLPSFHTLAADTRLDSRPPTPTAQVSAGHRRRSPTSLGLRIARADR